MKLNGDHPCKESVLLKKFTWDNEKMISQDEDYTQQDWPMFPDPLHPETMKMPHSIS